MTHNYYELLYAFHIYRHNYRKGEQLNWNLGVESNFMSVVIFPKILLDMYFSYI